MTIQERKTLEEILRKRLEDDVTVRQMTVITDALHRAFEDMEAMEHDAKAKTGNDYLTAFLQAKRVAGRSEKTLKRYKYVIERFLAAESVMPWAVTVDHLRHYFASELERGISESSIRGYQDTMSSFFGWCWREGLLQKNPCGNLEPIKCPKLQKTAFSSTDIELKKEACGNNARDKAIVCFLLASGCRIEEVTRLNRNDIDFASKECTVYGKGAKERTVYLDEISVAVLQRYFATRKDNSVALFAGRRGERMTPSGIRSMLKRIEKASGVENIHPHRFRRTLATNLAKKGMGVQEVAAILGHEEVQTTMKYVCTEKDTVKHHYQTIVA